LAPVFFAITSILDKYTVDKVSKWVYDFLFYSSFFELLFSLIAYIFFDVNYSLISYFSLFSWIFLVYATYFYVKAIEKVDVSLVIPLWNSIPIFVLIISYFVFWKQISLLQFVGFIIVLFWAIIISTEWNFLKKFKINSAFYLMLWASFLYSLLFSISDFVVWKTNVATVAFWEWIWFFLWVLIFLFFKQSRTEIILWLKDFWFRKNSLFLSNNIFDKLGMITSYKAFSLAPNPWLVSVIWWIQSFIVLFFTIILSLFFPKIIKENIEKKVLVQKIIWMLIIFVGIYVLYLG
jgi:uncharacterized membrane protein